MKEVFQSPIFIILKPIIGVLSIFIAGIGTFKEAMGSTDLPSAVLRALLAGIVNLSGKAYLSLVYLSKFKEIGSSPTEAFLNFLLWFTLTLIIFWMTTSWIFDIIGVFKFKLHWSITSLVIFMLYLVTVFIVVFLNKADIISAQQEEIQQPETQINGTIENGQLNITGNVTGQPDVSFGSGGY